MKTFLDISYIKDGTKAQKLDMYLPETDNFPVFVFFHGGGLTAGDKIGAGEILAPYFVNRGIGFVSSNYRMYPEAKYPDFIEDGAAAVAWVKNNIENYGGSGKLYVGGSSAGGYLSMMLCYDAKYLGAHGIEPTAIAAYIHDAGQPTTHFNVMVERGFNRFKCAIDDAAPLYHVGEAKEYSPQLILVSDNDIKARYEQTMLLMVTLESLGYDMSRVKLEIMRGYAHTKYMSLTDESGNSIFGEIVTKFLEEMKI